MKISFKWLSQYIDLEDYQSKLGELSALLTKAGLEVEDMNNPAEDWDKVVVGKLLEVGTHPDADRLTLCQVDVAGQKPLQIVCGAKNHKKGDLVAVAQVGAVLPGDFKIKKSKIRGVESFGMLCSEKELGLSEESEGIMILPTDLKIGAPMSEVCDQADILFELNVTPNRADCLSHIGLARELSTLLDRPVKMPEANIKETGKNVNDWIDVQLKDNQGCPRYCGRVISGVKVGSSPAWLKNAIEGIGLNSVNNIVDVTNFVLFEYGQPLHAFDFSQIKDAKIVIEKANEKEAFVTLDGTEVKLSDHDLVIRDGGRAVALAGVVGGQNSGVSESTQDIFLESAFFRADGVRRTSRAHGIETDSCYRFSRGVDPEQTLSAMNRAAALIVEVAGGDVQTGHVDIYPEPLKFQDIEVTPQYVAQRLGFDVSPSDFVTWMKRLNCLVSEKEGGFRVTPPSYRWDLRIKEDLVEEYARLHGYDAISEKLPQLVEEPTNHHSGFLFSNKVTQILSGLGIDQALNYAFIGKGQAQELWGSADKSQGVGLAMSPESIELLNPISEELSVMRESLLPSMLKNLVYNEHHNNHYGRLFEMGSAHFLADGKESEEGRLALMFWGQAENLWNKKKNNQVVYQLKSVVETLLKSLGGKNWRWDAMDVASCPPGFHPGQSAKLFYEGKHIGLLGSLHPLIKDEHKIRTQVAWVELNFDRLGMRQPRSPQFKSLPKFPAMERDVAFLAKESIAADKIGSEIKKSAGPLLTHFEVFDIYQDADLKAAGQRSIAFRLRFQSEKETLNDELINGLRDKVVNSLCQKLGLEIR
ncbi:MAG: phenylalanine--tRNA ligase subunit beta [Pseudomonadota bacterium]